MKEFIEILAVLIVGPMVGVEFAVAAFANPIIGRLPDDAFRAARSDGSRVLGKTMPFWYLGALAVLIVAALFGGPARWLIGVAAGLLAAVVVLTVTVLVPINNRIAAWPASGEVSRELAARWDRLHSLRVAILALVLVLPTVACFG